VATVDVRPFEEADARAVARLATAVQWPSLTDPEVVRRVCTAPGAHASVAVTGGEVVGWAQVLSDGVLQACTPTTGAVASPGCWCSPPSRQRAPSGWT
jgi:hypothetical protein